MKSLSIDFDGTIHDFQHPKEGRRMGLPMPGTLKALLEFKRLGYQIIIYTVFAEDDRAKKVVEEFMKYYELPYDEITNIKQKCDFYIDDNALRFEGNWEDIIEKVK